ncbi:MAG: c-type cytochrome [Sphingorhabdus sp.]|uniref:c-type cytochrome n=1 Tax=Sphingorhabdus sp. TaxID=1902408 RepID=UPI0038FD1E10
MVREVALPLLAAIFLVSAATAQTKKTLPIGNPIAGKVLYEAKCGGCHSLDANRIGPLHRGVVGRRPGAVTGYAYSTGVKALGGIWTPARLNQWLQGPQQMARGSKMFTTVSHAVDRRDIIAYLQSVSPPNAKGP